MGHILSGQRCTSEGSGWFKQARPAGLQQVPGLRRALRQSRLDARRVLAVHEGRNVERRALVDFLQQTL